MEPNTTPSFNDFKLNKQLLTAVADAGFTEPTPVQVQTIPLLLAGHDVLGIEIGRASCRERVCDSV